MEINLNHISKKYNDKWIFENFSFSMNKGEEVCVMGESGKGKTTLFRLLLGLELVDSGLYENNGAEFSAVFQENRLFERYSAVANIKMVCDKSISQEDIESKLKQLLPNVDLSVPLSSYSGGMKRRVAILRSLMASSDFVIMDEPLTGLDKETRDMTMQFILDNIDERGFLYSTHHLEEFEILGGKKIEIL